MQAPDRLLYYGWDGRLYDDSDIIRNYKFFNSQRPYTRRLANALIRPCDIPEPLRYAQARDLHSESTARLQFSWGDSRKTRRQIRSDRQAINQLWLQSTIETDRAKHERAKWLREQQDEEDNEEET